MVPGGVCRGTDVDDRRVVLGWNTPPINSCPQSDFIVSQMCGALRARGDSRAPRFLPDPRAAGFLRLEGSSLPLFWRPLLPSASAALWELKQGQEHKDWVYQPLFPKSTSVASEC